jgi:hypothetical protein
MEFDASSYRGYLVLDRMGERLGRLEEIHRDTYTDQPQWGRIELDAPGKERTLVPLVGASLAGQDLQVEYEKHMVINAPDHDAAELHRYYSTASGADTHGLLGPPRDWP